MLTAMTETDWTLVLRIFELSRSRRGGKGETLAGLSESAHLVQMFDSTMVRAHVSAAGAKRGRRMSRSGVRAVAFQRQSTSRRSLTG